MASIISKRFIACVELLKQKGLIRSYRQFAQSMDFTPQNLSDIKNGKRDVTIELLRQAIQAYQLNADYIFLGQEPMIMSVEEKKNQFKVLPIITDQSGNERISHVAIPARAGYASESSNPSFIEELPSYSLPDYRFQTGTYRSFDVEGESMEPTFYEKDRVICSFIEPSLWRTSIKDSQVYIVVTHEDILLKRIITRSFPLLKLHSDNSLFDPYEVHINKIKEIWHVKYKLSAFDHLESPSDDSSNADINELKSLLKNQSEMIRILSMRMRTGESNLTPTHEIKEQA